MKKRKHYYIVKVISPTSGLHFEFKRGANLEVAKDLKRAFDNSGSFKTLISVR